MIDDECANSDLSAEERVPAESAIGQIDLGRVPALGLRARVLAGLTTVAAAAIVIAMEPGTGSVTHTGPVPPLF
ncbi:hypothetical protein [Krasilnikovia sp. MM14-A1259]|uniref:hypothetical protein n=1 Tax=Krasilnikovia sp. MM14-A1259 TaxID=3373539 RepID=UPI00380EF07E